MRKIAFFFRFFVWFSVRHLRMHPGRAVTVLCGIALGAAVFTSVRLSINASLDSFSRSMDLIAGRADRVLIRPAGRVPERLVAKLLNHPRVESASPLLTTYIRPTQKDADPFLLIGFDPILDRSIRKWEIDARDKPVDDSWLDLLIDPFTLIISKSLAKRYRLNRGDTISVEHARGQEDFSVIGILAPDGLSLVEGGQVALTDIATFQEFTKLHGYVDRVDLLLKPDTTTDVLDQIRKLLPANVIIGSPSSSKESGQGMIRAYQLNLSILSFASLFVGMFLVYSLVALNAASRRHELAVLRSTGASPYLLFVIFLTEGALLGVAGWLMAIPISSFLVKYLLSGVSQTISTLFVRVQVDRLSFSLWELALSFGVTVSISILAALQPAREAMKVSPKEALEISQHGTLISRSPRKLAQGGLLCIMIVLPFSQIPAILGVPIPGYVAILLLFVGFSFLAPWFLVFLAKLVTPTIRRLAGMPAYLAGHYVQESGMRTAVSVGALITAVALFASLVIMIFSFRQTVEMWTYQSVSGDLFLTTKLNEINKFRDPIPQKIVNWLQSLETDVEVAGNRRFFLNYNNFPYEFEVLDLDVYLRYADFIWMQGDSQHIRSRLLNGEGVVISEVFSNRTGLTIGDTYRARVEESLVELPILGIIRDYRTQGGVVFYSLEHFQKRFYNPGWGGVRFFLRDRTQNLSKAVARLRTNIIDHWGDTLDMISGKDLREAILQVFDETFAVTMILLLIALVIAALGIATTLTVLVLERSKQLNTLLAVGASRGQIRSMIFWEAAFMVIAGEIGGTICGFILSYLLVYVINKQSFGWTFLYGVDWGALGFSLPLIIMTALAAAFPAINLVFRKPPAALLRE